MTNLSIRGLDDQALALLKRRAAQQGASVNSLVVGLIERGLGLKPDPVTPVRHDDLDALAGTWNREEAAAFKRATSTFSTVDPDLWK